MNTTQDTLIDKAALYSTDHFPPINGGSLGVQIETPAEDRAELTERVKPVFPRLDAVQHQIDLFRADFVCERETTDPLAPARGIVNAVLACLAALVGCWLAKAVCVGLYGFYQLVTGRL